MAYVTDAMRKLEAALLKLEPGTKSGGTYANKPGYHNTRRQNQPTDYSVCDKPPDHGGPGDVCAAIDWTFPEAQRGDYTRIIKYTVRLLKSAKDPNDPRLNGWREFYGQADKDAYVEGWDTRYGHAVSSDSSHLWHIHISENRDQTESWANKEALLSVLRGETLEEWEDDVTAKDVWNYDVDPSANKYSAGGVQWTTFQRTDYIANKWAPSVDKQLADITAQLKALSEQIADLSNK